MCTLFGSEAAAEIANYIATWVRSNFCFSAVEFPCRFLYDHKFIFIVLDPLMTQQLYWRDIQIHHVFSDQTVAAVQWFWYSLYSENLEEFLFTSCLFLTSSNDIMQLQEVVSLTLSFCLLAAILQPSLCAADKVYYVTPDSETACPSTPCYNTSHYISVYFQSKSMFKFLPGVHILDAGGVVVEFVNNIEQWYNGTLRIWIPLSTIQQNQMYGPIWFCIYVCEEFTHRKLFIL